MKKIILTFVSLLFTNLLLSQINVEVKDSKISFGDVITASTFIIKKAGGDVEFKAGQFETQCKSDNTEKEIGGVYYIMDCAKNKIDFYTKDDKKTVWPLYYCKDKNVFSRKEDCKTAAATDKKNEDPVISDINQIPFPQFKKDNDEIIKNNKSSRYLFIDAHPNQNRKINTNLYKPLNPKDFGKDTFDENFQKATALPINSSLTVFIRNYNFHQLEKVTITVSGEDYEYTLDINDLYKASKKKGEETPKDSIKSTAATDKLKTDLTVILTKLKTYKYLNSNDLYIVENYKRNLEKFHDDNITEFNKENISVYSEIIHWYPEYISLTPTSLLIPENDVVDISMSIKNVGETEASSQKIGRYKTVGGITFGLGSMLYLTNLRNNDVYTETVKAEGQADKLFAKMNSNDQLSLGIGLNSEVFFRTGSLLRPTINLGFFVPFDEELSPFVAVGPGISIASNKLKFSFSYGLAIGKINSIKQNYVDKDLTGMNLTIEGMTEKVWKTGHYFGIGLRYNLSTSD